MTSYPFCDVVVRSDDACPPNGNTEEGAKALTEPDWPRRKRRRMGDP